MSNTSITIQSVSDFARLHSKLVPLIGVGGISGEPTLSIANDVIAEIFSPPFNWKWNRNEMTTFVTQQYKQDYLFAGASAIVLQNSTNAPAPNCGGVGIDLVSNNGITESGTTVTVKTLEAHPFKVGQTVYITGTGSAYDSPYSLSNGVFSGGWTITAVPNTLSFQFTHTSSGLAASGAPGITNFGWLESASVIDVSNSCLPQPVFTTLAVKMLDPSSETSNPEKFAVIKDYGNGILKIRCWPVPSTYIWGINLVYQGKAPVISSVVSSWSPIPDELAFVYRQGFIARAYRFVDNNRADTEYQVFQMNIVKALGEKDAELDTQGFYPSRPILL